MNRVLKSTGLLCGLLLFAGSVLRADPATASSPDLLAEALPILQTSYLDAQKLSVKEGGHLADLIAGSNGAISLCVPESNSASVSILTAFLPGNIVYWRLASFTPKKSWSDLTMELDQWNGQGARGIVLDLRSNVAPDDYAGAVQVANFFTPDGTTLFTARNASGGDHAYTIKHNESPFHQPIVLLIDNQTVGAAEALAASLKMRGALVIGQATKGRAAIFGEQKLPSGQLLRFITAQVFLPDGSQLWGHPVNPDIGLTINEQTEKSALALIEQNRILDVTHEAAERRRLSEATLVQGKNPEWDDYLASREKKPDASVVTKPAIQDIALINALDSLKAIQLAQRWTGSPLGSVAPPESSSSIQ